MAQRGFDPADWVGGSIWEQEEAIPVQLKSGGWFPRRVAAGGRYRGGPAVEMELGVADGRIVVFSVTFRSYSVPDGIAVSEDVRQTFNDPPITAAAVRSIPLGSIIDLEIGRITMRTRDRMTLGRDRPWSQRDLEEADARRISRRGRPVGDETLRRVAAIVRENRFDPRRQIHDEIGASPRTASRWIAEARRRGYITEED